MDKFRLNEKTRTVRAYNEDIVSQEDFNQLERFRKLDYKVVLVPKKPREYKHIKIDMVKYLEDNIDKDIYNEFIDRVEKKQNFLKLKWWLIKALQEKEEEQAKKEKREIKKIDAETIEEIINQAKSKESKLIENIKAQATIENKKVNADKDKSNKDKDKSNENEWN